MSRCTNDRAARHRSRSIRSCVDRAAERRGTQVKQLYTPPRPVCQTTLAPPTEALHAKQVAKRQRAESVMAHHGGGRSPLPSRLASQALPNGNHRVSPRPTCRRATRPTLGGRPSLRQRCMWRPLAPPIKHWRVTACLRARPSWMSRCTNDRAARHRSRSIRCCVDRAAERRGTEVRQLYIPPRPVCQIMPAPPTGALHAKQVAGRQKAESVMACSGGCRNPHRRTSKARRYGDQKGARRRQLTPQHARQGREGRAGKEKGRARHLPPRCGYIWPTREARGILGYTSAYGRPSRGGGKAQGKRARE